ncbi:MAG: hypothetical protein KTM48_01445, partial [Wolbachia endosymbiont of Pissodes strobi]|nr:hypothetical protein [Wolbachia endosymbiont of Pissodes strobi]
CQYCGEQTDTPEHTMFICPRWDCRRIELTTIIGENISVENTLEKMTESKQNFDAINKFITDVMSIKYHDET